MKVQELEAKIEEKRIDKRFINIGTRGNFDECFNLIRREDGKWEMFYGEHGQKSNPVVFDTEEEACDAFWEDIKDTVYRDPPFPKAVTRFLDRLGKWIR